MLQMGGYLSPPHGTILDQSSLRMIQRGTNVFGLGSVGSFVWRAGNGVFTTLLCLGLLDKKDCGAQSVVLSGCYEDHGEWFLYIGSGGRDLCGNKWTNKEQSFDQKFESFNESLRVSYKKVYPVGVVRCYSKFNQSYSGSILRG